MMISRRNFLAVAGAAAAAAALTAFLFLINVILLFIVIPFSYGINHISIAQFCQYFYTYIVFFCIFFTISRLQYSAFAILE